jgi:DNA polymerase III epsilon subunit-like protein
MSHQLTFESLLNDILPEKQPNDDREESGSLEPTAYIFIDLETGGLEPTRHSILQVAAVITDLDLKIRGHFMSYIRPHPDLEINDEALAINQLCREELEFAPIESRVALALKHFAHTNHFTGSSARFAGYNCKFDLEFLDGMWKRHELLPAPYAVPWLDIYAVTKTKFGSDSGLPNFRLTTVATHLGISPHGAHDAHADLIMTIEVAKRLRALPDREGAALVGPARFTK